MPLNDIFAMVKRIEILFSGYQIIFENSFQKENNVIQSWVDLLGEKKHFK